MRRLHRLARLMCVAAFAFVVTAAWAVDKTPSSATTVESPSALTLSADERAYLRSLPPLTVALDASPGTIVETYPAKVSDNEAFQDVAYLSRALGINLVLRPCPDAANAATLLRRRPRARP